MRRGLGLALLGLAVLGSACASFPGSGGARRAAPPPSRLQAILDRGVLRVATSTDLPPLTMRNRAGEITGFEIDLVKALGLAMDLEVRFVETPFPSLLQTLERGEVDLAIGGITMTPARNARVAFAGPYFISGTSLVTRSLEPEQLADVTALDDPARSFAALEGSTSAGFVEKNLPKARLVVTRDYGTAIEKLLAGEVDAVVADFLACRLAEWRNPGKGLHALRTPLTTEPLGIALPADDPLLLNLVQNYLNTLDETGELTVLKAHWLSQGAWLDQLP